MHDLKVVSSSPNMIQWIWCSHPILEMFIQWGTCEVQINLVISFIIIPALFQVRLRVYTCTIVSERWLELLQEFASIQLDYL